MGIVGVTMWFIGVLDLLTKSSDPPSISTHYSGESAARPHPRPKQSQMLQFCMVIVHPADRQDQSILGISQAYTPKTGPIKTTVS